MPEVSAAIYAKNVPGWERLVRVALSIFGIAYGWSLPTPWSWAVVASAAAFALTGLFGFCPACATLRRRPVSQEPR